MSSLTDIIGRVIELCEIPGVGIDVHHAIEAAFPLVLADKDAVDMLVREGIAKRVKQKVTGYTNVQIEAQTTAPDLFGKLHPAYPVDLEQRRLKRTEDLTLLEFQRVIAIRKEQIVHDTAHLKILTDSFDAVNAIWTAHPELTFGAVLDLHRASSIAAE